MSRQSKWKRSMSGRHYSRNAHGVRFTMFEVDGQEGVMVLAHKDLDYEARRYELMRKPTRTYASFATAKIGVDRLIEKLAGE